MTSMGLGSVIPSRKDSNGFYSVGFSEYENGSSWRLLDMLKQPSGCTLRVLDTVYTNALLEDHGAVRLSGSEGCDPLLMEDDNSTTAEERKQLNALTNPNGPLGIIHSESLGRPNIVNTKFGMFPILSNNHNHQDSASISSAELENIQLDCNSRMMVRFLRCVLELGGVMPCNMCSPHFYTFIILVVVVLPAVHHFTLAVTTPSARYVHLSSGTFALGAFLGLALLRFNGIAGILGPKEPLWTYAIKLNFERAWTHTSVLNSCIVLMLWLLFTLVSIVPNALLMHEGCSDSGLRIHLQTLASILVTNSLMAVLVICQLVVINFFEHMIDHFCVSIFGKCG